MQIDIEMITNGSYDGKRVWVCDYRFKDLDQKPIRHVQPMEVLVRSNSEIKTNVYYSKSHFVKLNKQGKPVVSQIFKPYDNTGFRSYKGEPLNVFDNEAECVSKYNELCYNISAALDVWFKEKQNYYINMKKELKLEVK